MLYGGVLDYLTVVYVAELPGCTALGGFRFLRWTAPWRVVCDTFGGEGVWYAEVLTVPSIRIPRTFECAV